MSEQKRCPFCEALMDAVALATNVCSACGNVIGDLGKAAMTLELVRGQEAVSCELFDRNKGKETVVFEQSEFDSSFWDEPPSDDPSQESEHPRLVVNRRQFDVDGVSNPDYRVFSKLGSGGMGEIFDATQESLGREVAIKISKGGAVGSDNASEKFRVEAAVTGNLEHPNIVPIYDLGLNSDNKTFFAMKKVNGTPWSKAISGYSLQENIEILLRVCDAVAFAHSKGVIHRDLKPENVMIGEFSEVLVMDWGLAAGVFEGAKAPKVTYADAIAGTPAYMAPEMARGQEKKIGFTSDIYLLGAILFEIITGEPPHGGKTVRECLSAAAQNKIAESWVSSELLKTALKAMATEQADRYGSVREFQSGIREHFKSVELATRARKHLALARKGGNYHDYFRALFGFREALETWPGNDEAGNSLHEAVTELIKLAVKNGEKVLARSLLEEAINPDPQLVALVDKL